jgi:hypothetical protein
VSTVRALLAAHLQSTFNRSRKELGKQGQLAVVLIVAVSALGMLPLLPLAAVGGYLTARGLPARWATYVLGGFLGAVPLVLGLTGAVFGGSRRLAWESYRVYPVRLLPLFFSEILAGFADVWSLVYLACGAAFGVGVCVNRPLLAPLYLLLFGMSLAWMASTELLVGSLGAALVKRLRWVLVALGLLLWMASILGGQAADRMRGRRLDETGLARAKAVAGALAAVWEWMPSTHSALGLAAAVGGDVLAAIGHQVYPLAFTVLLLGWTYVLLSRETAPARQENLLQGPSRASRGWTFRHPVEGVGRLHWDLLIRSHFGRFSLLFPLVTVVLLKGPFARAPGMATWAVPIAFGYLALTGANLQFNQFGLDGPGIKALLLLPITGRTLLLGKLWGLAVHQALQSLVLVVLLALLMRPSLATLAAGVLLAASLFVWQVGVGHWVSVWQPRRAPLDKIKGANPPLAAALVQLTVTALGMSVLGGAWALAAALAPAWLIPSQLAALALCVALYRAVLPHAAAYLERQQERLVERLG